MKGGYQAGETLKILCPYGLIDTCEYLRSESKCYYIVHWARFSCNHPKQDMDNEKCPLSKEEKKGREVGGLI